MKKKQTNAILFVFIIMRANLQFIGSFLSNMPRYNQNKQRFQRSDRGNIISTLLPSCNIPGGSSSLSFVTQEKRYHPEIEFTSDCC